VFAEIIAAAAGHEQSNRTPLPLSGLRVSARGSPYRVGSLARVMVAWFESVSTWWQPVPAPGSLARSALIDTVAGQVAELSAGWLRVAVDGLTGAGKTAGLIVDSVHVSS
jgi:hypothetical protein